MPKCNVCGGHVDWIVIDNEQLGTSSRVADDCPRCVPRGCSCCDPTHDSPDPVVVRLQKEVEEAKRKLTDYVSYTNGIHGKFCEWLHECDPGMKPDATLDGVVEQIIFNLGGKNDAWALREQELLEQLRQQSKSFCTHCGKLFPGGKEGVAQFREHIAECNKHPLHTMATENARLRGLLREALEASWLDDEWWGNEIPDEWFVRAQAALEGKS